ncbi:MAG: hypothetical protein J6Y87_06845, partial [Muribaculaceae bacterium]|nr:hypothetical protein [Muribaculaceae bacterium]
RQQWGNGINSVELTEGDSADSFADSYSPTADNRIYDITGRLVGILAEGESLSSLCAEGRLSRGIYILHSHKFAISR